MIILNKKLLDEFAYKHADIRSALQKWIDIIEEAQWISHIDLKEDFPSADYVGNERYVFNIKGNKYRIVVIIIFIANLINIRFLGTHAEYDKIQCGLI